MAPRASDGSIFSDLPFQTKIYGFSSLFPIQTGKTPSLFWHLAFQATYISTVLQSIGKNFNIQNTCTPSQISVAYPKYEIPSYGPVFSGLFYTMQTSIRDKPRWKNNDLPLMAALLIIRLCWLIYQDWLYNSPFNYQLIMYVHVTLGTNIRL